jgi:hypothetical protein
MARAEGLSGLAEPGFAHQESETREPTGATTRSEREVLTQRYQLNLDRSVTDALTASAGGTLLDERGWGRTQGVSTDLHAQSSTLFARLSLGIPVLTASAGVDRTEQQTLSRSGVGFVTMTYAASGAWRPIDLPELQLRVARNDSYDTAHVERDVTTDTAQLSTRMRTPRWEVGYLLGWTRDVDHLSGVETTLVEQTGRATRSDSLFDGRTTTYLSGTIQARNSSVLAGSGGGFVTTQQLPATGLSAVLALPATVQNVVLVPNPAVIDGNTTTSAGVNLGFGLAASGDQNARDVGAGFADDATVVNKIYLWLDRSMSPEVIKALRDSIQVSASTDNQHWTPVRIDGAPTTGQVDRRFEIPILQTHARYLKVTVQPLASGVTLDDNFRELFVTEIQFLLVLPVTEVPRHSHGLFLAGTAIGRTLLLRAPELVWDITANGTHREEVSVTDTYSLVNGLSTSQRLTPTITGRARAARQDSSNGVHHEGAWLWNAGLAGSPLPTAGWALTYDGTYTDQDVISHNLSASGRADLYEGVSTQANTGYTLTATSLRVGQTFQVSGTTTLSPNRRVTLTAGGLYSRTSVNDAYQGFSWTQSARVDATLSVTPVPALSAVGTVSRVMLVPRPSTFATLNVSYSPLRGDLQVSVAYSKTLATDSDETTERVVPSLRWNIRSGVSLTATYSYAQASSPVLTTTTRTLGASLLVVF